MDISQYSAPDQPTHQAPVRGRALVINSSVSILQTFLFFYHRNPAVLMCWSIGQQAFNACMILLLDAWETESGENNAWLADQVYAVFRQLQINGVHRLAELAAQRIEAAIISLRNKREERQDAKVAMSRRASEHSQPQLHLDTASMTDWTGDTVMGNTGMFLLEDPGLQYPQASPFTPLGWNMAGSQPSAHSTTSSTPAVQSPSIIPVSQVTAAPFPIMTSPPFVTGAGAIPVTNSPYAVGLQPRLTSTQRRSSSSARQGHYPTYPPQYQQQTMPQAMFTPVNAGMPAYQGGIQQMSPQVFAQGRRASGSQVSGVPGQGNGTRAPQRVDRSARSQQRRR